MDEDGIAGCVGCIVLIVIIVIAAPVLSFLSEAITSVFNFAGDVIAFIESAIAFTAAFLTGLGTVTIGSALLIGVLAGTSAVVRLVSPVNNRKRGYTNLAREHKHKANPKAIQEQSAVEHKADSGRVTEAEQRAQVFREAQRKIEAKRKLELDRNAEFRRKAMVLSARSATAERKSSIEANIAKTENARQAEHASAKRRFKEVDSVELDRIIQDVFNRIDIVRSGSENLRGTYRKAIDGAVKTYQIQVEAQKNATKKFNRKSRQQGKAVNQSATTFGSEQEIQTKEQIQLRGELKELEKRHDQLARKLRDVTFRGGKKSKNADYHDTREQLIFVEDRIQAYEESLRNSFKIQANGPNKIVQIGSTVVIRYSDNDENEVYKIVSTPLLKRSESKISVKSPMGSALLGKKRGAKVNVQTPDGLVFCKIINVQ